MKYAIGFISALAFFSAGALADPASCIRTQVDPELQALGMGTFDHPASGVSKRVIGNRILFHSSVGDSTLSFDPYTTILANAKDVAGNPTSKRIELGAACGIIALELSLQNHSFSLDRASCLEIARALHEQKGPTDCSWQFPSNGITQCQQLAEANQICARYQARFELPRISVTGSSAIAPSLPGAGSGL